MEMRSLGWVPWKWGPLEGSLGDWERALREVLSETWRGPLERIPSERALGEGSLREGPYRGSP